MLLMRVGVVGRLLIIIEGYLLKVTAFTRQSLEDEPPVPVIPKNSCVRQIR